MGNLSEVKLNEDMAAALVCCLSARINCRVTLLTLNFSTAFSSLLLTAFMLIEAELILLENWSQIHFQRRSFGENLERNAFFNFKFKPVFCSFEGPF